jgi:hypothetical protein
MMSSSRFYDVVGLDERYGARRTCMPYLLEMYVT